MSTGDFGIELQQSVQANLEAIEAMAREAKMRIAIGIETAQPANLPSPGPAPAPKRYNVSFDDAFEPAPAPFITEPQVDEGIPVWEDTP